MRFTLLAVLAALVLPAAAGAAPPSYMDDPLEVCLPIPADSAGDQNDGESPECLNQPDDGHAVLEPSTLKVGQEATLTWVQGAFHDKTTVGGWYYDSTEYPTRMLVGRRNDEDPTQQPTGFLQPIYGDDCFHAESCRVKLVAPYQVPLWEGYYRAQIRYATTSDISHVGEWDVLMRVVKNVKPQAAFSVRRVRGLEFEIDGSTSVDDTGIAEWDWNVPTYPDADPPDQARFTYTFPEEGSYLIRLIVFDAEGESSVYEEQVEIRASDEVPEPSPSPSPTPYTPPPATGLPTPIADLERPPAAAPSPLTGLAGLPRQARPDRKGRLKVGRASNPPAVSTVQKLVAGEKTLASGRAAIPAGASKALRVKLTATGRKALRRAKRVKATLVITALGASGASESTRRSLILKRP